MLSTHSHILALSLTPRFVYIGITINSCNLLHNTQQERTYILAKPDPRTHVGLCLPICSLPHEPAMHLFFYTLKIHLGDQHRAARDWLVADMSSESRSGCQGQQCEPLGYVLASALNGLMCRLNLESLDSSQGCWEFCNILGLRAYLENTFAPFQL